MNNKRKELREEIQKSLDNKFLRKSMDNFALAYRKGHEKAYSGLDKDKLVSEVAAAKDFALAEIDSLMDKFTKNAESKGMKVHFAKNAEEANSIIAKIAENTGSRKIVKSKSMTSEETLLNHYLEDRNFEVTETDLGEWIIQMRHEGPSHMVMPAIHLSRYQVSDLFENLTHEKQNPENIDSLVKVARKELRKKFAEADMGITGANFLLADTGTIGLVTNEGNARQVSTLPKTHVVLAGIDKVLPSVSEALKILKVLPRNATGQILTAYVTWITGQTECLSHEKKKKDIHIVLLDNGRSEMAKDPEFSKVFRCVRCGACANVCPVYRMVGGHTMGHIYIGAIGLILTYFFHGRDEAEKLIGNCIGCGACRTVCAGGIDLPNLIKAIAHRIEKEKGGAPVSGQLLSAVMKNRRLFHTLLKFGKFAQKPVKDSKGYLRHLPMIFAKEQNFRTLPAIADKSFRDIWKEVKPRLKNPKMTIALFAGCVQDFIYPEQLKAFVEILEAENIAVEFPAGQTCCGLPLKMMDRVETVKDITDQNLEAFDPRRYEYIVTLCASCASQLVEYPMIKKSGRSEEFAEKIITSGKFLSDIVRPGLSKNLSDKKVTFHSPCHLHNCMKADKQAREMIEKTGAAFTRAEDEMSCCGFGGSYSVKYPEISSQILKNKIGDFVKTGASEVITECPGCIIQLRGGADKENAGLIVRHLVELIREAM
jgi:iron-sulfur cluster protein